MEKKSVILNRCLSLLLATYPPETARFLKGETDRFQNPVWYTITHEMESLFDELTGNMNPDKITRSLENIIRIRAVQEFSPTEALSFVSCLRQAFSEETTRDKVKGKRLKVKDKRSEVRGARSEVKESDKDEALVVENLTEIEVRMDRIADLASWIYQATKEKIHELQLRGLTPPPAPQRKPKKL